MKTGIDSYCYHRFFGEVYPQQTAPPRSMTLEDFLRRAHDLGVDGVSLESCFIPNLDAGIWRRSADCWMSTGWKEYSPGAIPMAWRAA